MASSNTVMKAYLDKNNYIALAFFVSVYGREERCTEGFGGETCGTETTWKTA
jgi:hypothetical protein